MALLFDNPEPQRAVRDQFTLNLDSCRERAVSIASELQKLHTWTDTDWRVAIVHRVKNVVQSVTAFLMFHRSIFPSRAYWEVYFKSVPTEVLFADFYKEADVLIRVSLLQGVFTSIESDLRLILLRIDPIATKEATEPLWKVTKWLVGRVPRLESYVAFLRLLLFTRNTTHHNGVFQPTGGQNENVTWKGKTFAFEVGKSVDFVNGAFLAWLVDESLSMLRDVLDDPAIVSLPAV